MNKLHAAMYGPQQKAQVEAERMDEVRPCYVLQPFHCEKGGYWAPTGFLIVWSMTFGSPLAVCQA